MSAAGFVPPPYPYDRLEALRREAAVHDGGVVDCSIGTPFDPPPPFVSAALAGSGTERGYPASIGTPGYREACAGWVRRRFGVTVDPDTEVAACVGTKEFVATLPQWLSLRTPGRDVVLYPEVSYPTYAMGATLAGCRPVPVPVDEGWRLRLEAVDPADAERAVVLWANTPSNPTGALDDLAAVAEWGRSRGVLVASDECYAEFTWEGRPRSVLATGLDGVLAVHSLSKRSNAAGLRAGFYAGDPDVVGYLREVRKHAGFMVPGPVQAAGEAAWADDAHVAEQRARYARRLERMAGWIEAVTAAPVARPAGGFYLWVAAPDGDAWAFAAHLAVEAGLLVSPGEFYGPAGAGHVRIAVVPPDDRLALVGRRLGLPA